MAAIFKKGSKRLASNYRPISLTCIIRKILESIIRDQMLEFFMQNNKLVISNLDFYQADHALFNCYTVFRDGSMNWRTTTLWQFSTRISEKRLIVYCTVS